jgi:hypothetical protein
MTHSATLVALGLLLTGCSVPDRYPPGGPYCFVLYADYSLKPARLLAKARAEAVALIGSGRPVVVAMVNSDGLVERTRECYRSHCTDWKVYEYDPRRALLRTDGEGADAGFDVNNCPKSPPQSAVRLPM